MGVVRIGLWSLGAALAVALLSGPQSARDGGHRDSVSPVAGESQGAREYLQHLEERARWTENKVTALSTVPQAGEFLIKTDREDYLAFRRPTLETSEGVRLVAPKVQPYQAQNVALYSYGEWNEEYAQGGTTIQQTFWIRGPLDGEITIRIPFETSLQPATLFGGSIAFLKGRYARLGYRDAHALDAAGRTQRLEPELADGEIRLTIPEEWVSQASFPILVDPLVFAPASSLTAGVSSSFEWLQPNLNMAWNPDQNRYLMTWYTVLATECSFTGLDGCGGTCSPPGANLSGDAYLEGHVDAAQVWGRSIYLFREFPPGDGYYVVGDPPTGALLNAPFQLAGPVDAPAAGFDPCNPDGGVISAQVCMSPTVIYRPSPDPTRRMFVVMWSGGNRAGFDGVGYYDAVADVHPTCHCHQTFNRSRDHFSFDAQIFGRRFNEWAQAATDTLDPTPVQISNGNLGTANAFRNPRVAWDGVNFVVVYEYNPATSVFLNSDATPANQDDPISPFTYSYWVRKYEVRMSFVNPATTTTPMALVSTATLTTDKNRFWISGTVPNPPLSAPPGSVWVVEGPAMDQVIDSMVPMIQLMVPMDSDPDIAALPGRAAPGVAWGVPPPTWTGAWPPPPGSGSVGVYTVTSILFQIPKSRIRGYYTPSGSTAPVFTWEVYNPLPDDPNTFPWKGDTMLGVNAVPLLVGRPSIAARIDDRPGYLVTYQSIRQPIALAVPIVPPNVDLLGDIYYRTVSRTGRNASPPSIAAEAGELINDVAHSHLWPRVAWSNRSRQFLLTWTTTDAVLWNPKSLGMSYVPRADLFQDPFTITAPLASLGIAPTPAFDDEVRLAVLRSDLAVEIPKNLMGKVPQENMGIATTSQLDLVSTSGTLPATGTVYMINASGTGSDLPWQMDTIVYHNVQTGWLSADVTSGLLPRPFGDPTRQPTGYPAWWQTVTLTGDPAGLPPGLYQATVVYGINPAVENNPRVRKVRLPVTFAVGVPSTPAPYVDRPVLGFLTGMNNPPPAAQQIQMDNRGLADSMMVWSSTIDYGGGPTGWLTINPTGGQIYEGYPQILALSINKSVLADPVPLSGDTTYTATIKVASSGSTPSAFDIPVTLVYRDQPVYDQFMALLEDDSSDAYCQRFGFQQTPIVADPVLSTTPSKLIFQWDPPDSSSLPLNTQTIAIENTPVEGNDVLSVLTWTAESQNNWITINPKTGKHRPGDVPNQMTVTVDPTSFGIGVYDGSILINGSEGQTRTVQVQLIVGKVGGISFQPLMGELNWERFFNIPRYSPPPPPAESGQTAVSFSIADQKGIDLQFALQDFNWSPAHSGHWLMRSIPGWLQVEVYDDVTAAFIKLNPVTDPTYDPELDNWSQSNSFTQQGVRKYDPTPPTQARTLRFRADHTSILWSGPPLPAGTYFATVVFEADVPGVRETEILVVMQVKPEPPLVPVIGATPAWVPFQMTQGDPNPTPVTLSIRNDSPGTLLKAKYTIVGFSTSWLIVSPPAGTILDTDTVDEDGQTGNDGEDGLGYAETKPVTVSVSASSLAPGTYEADIQIEDTVNFGNKKTVPVVLIVNPAAPNLVVSPTTLSFRLLKGDPNPAPQVLTVSNTGADVSVLSYTVNFQPQNWWLLVDGKNKGVASGSAIGQVSKTHSISVDAANMDAGSYSGTLTIEDTAATGSPATVTVTLLVEPPSSNGTLVVEPTTLTLSATQGGINPANQPLTIRNTASASTVVNYLITADQTWVIATPTSGGPIMGGQSQDVFVTAGTAGLAVGTHNAILTVSATGAQGSPKTVSIVLNVSAASVAAGSSRSTRGSGKKGGGCAASAAPSGSAPPWSHAPWALLAAMGLGITLRASSRRRPSTGGLP